MAELGDVLAGVRCAIEPLDTALTDEHTLTEFLADFGWDITVSAGALTTIRTGFGIRRLFDAALAVAQQLESASATPNPSLINSLREAVVGLIDGITSLSTSPPTAGMP